VRAIDRTTFRDEVQEAGENLSPARAGLLIAREIAYADLRPSDYLIQLEDLAAAAGRFLAPHAGVEARGLALAEYLFRVLGFRGDDQDYYDPRNAYLNEVLDRRLGLPISLSVIYLDLGERLRLPAAGVGLPGHFIVSVPAADGPLYLDPFHGGATLTPEACARRVRATSGYGGPFDPRWLAPTPAREIVARMLNNLRNFYTQMEDWPPAIRVLERLRDLQPEDSSHLRDLGVLHYRSRELRLALHWLEQYLAREPNAADFDAVRQTRDLLVERLARLN
jgi:regulator of sirC expression with transglutaminase-like and TPR domain